MGSNRTYRFGVFELRASTGELRRAGVRVRLARQTATLLLELVERPGDLVLRQELQQRLWPDTHVDRERGLTNAVNRLREILGDTATRARFIETVPKRGYRFVAPVEVVEPGPLVEVRPAPARCAWRPVAAAAAGLVAAALVAWAGLERRQSPALPYYLAAIQLQNRVDGGSLAAARTLLEQAVAADEDFAPAYGVLALNSLHLGEQGALPLRQAREAARSTALRALGKDTTLPDAHLALALVHLREDWGWSRAEHELQACLDAAPRSSSCLRAYASLDAARGRMDAALARIEQASLIDPLSAETHATAGRLLLFARRYPDAAARLRTALRIEPRFPAARKLLSDTLWHGGFQSDAHTAFLDWLAAVDVPATELTVVEATLRRDGLPGLWRTQLQRPDKPGAHPGLAFKRAAMLAGLGQIGPAIDALEAAASQRDAGVIFISVDPQFDAVAAAPRFQALLGRVGLPL